MTERKYPIAEANRLSVLLHQVLGAERFPVAVEELALDYSRQCFPHSPIAKIVGEKLPGLEGLLQSNQDQSRWVIVYNVAEPSPGRRRFTLAHEFGHYLLHRHLQSQFACYPRDLSTDDRELEAEADTFASFLLMPLDDYRKQVAGHEISFDLLSHCAERYGVSLTAAVLKWLEITEQRAILAVARDDHLLWAKSNRAALKSGAYFATRRHTVEVPDHSIAHSDHCIAPQQTASIPARVWFPKEPEDMPLTEMTKVSEQYDYTLTLLRMPEAEWPIHRQEEGASGQDFVDRFTRTERS